MLVETSMNYIQILGQEYQKKCKYILEVKKYEHEVKLRRIVEGKEDSRGRDLGRN